MSLGTGESTILLYLQAKKKATFCLNSGENYLTSRARIPRDCVSIDSHL